MASKKHCSILGPVIAVLAAIRDRWAQDLLEEVDARNQEERRLHRLVDEEESLSAETRPDD